MKKRTFRRYQMINKYEMLNTETAQTLSLKDLVAKYNDAIETTWHYQKIIFELRQENEEILAAYEDISNQFYG